MKTILSIFFLTIFFSFDGYSQIRIMGTENLKTETSNKEVTFIRKEVEITNSSTEEIETPIVIRNKITESKVYDTPEGVNVEIENSAKVDTPSSNQIIIDLEEVKKANQTNYTTTTTTIPATSTTIPTTSTTTNGFAPKESAGTKTVDAGPKVALSNNKVTPKVANENNGMLFNGKPTNTTTSTTVVEEKSAVQKESNTWSIGLNGGLAYVQGDVNTKLGYGGSITIRKAINHRFSLRLQSMFSETYGQDWLLKDNNPNYLNYKTRLTDHTLQAVVGLNARTPKRFLINFIAGAGFATKFTWINALNESGQAYDFTSINAPTSRNDKGDVLDALNTLQDSGFETAIGADQLKRHIKDTEISPAVVLGLGMAVKLSKRVDLNIEHRVSWYNSDKLDNYVTGGNDLMHYSTLGLNFKLGKNNVAAWWDPTKKVQITSDQNNAITSNEIATSTTVVPTAKTAELATKKVSPTAKTETVAPVQKAYDPNNVIGFTFFDTNSSTVKQEYYTELYKLNTLLTQNPGMKIVIVGHADIKGSEFNSTSIAKERAQSIYHFLTGIFKMDASRFETYYEGENNFKIPEGNVVFARNQSEKNKSVTIIIK